MFGYTYIKGRYSNPAMLKNWKMGGVIKESWISSDRGLVIYQCNLFGTTPTHPY